MKCQHCGRETLGYKSFSWFWFLVLFLFFGIGWFFYLIYYWTKRPDRCTECNGDLKKGAVSGARSGDASV